MKCVFSRFPVNVLAKCLTLIRPHAGDRGEDAADAGECAGGLYGRPAPLACGAVALFTKPFTTSKAVGLGIGLSISVSLMAQMKGDLRLARFIARRVTLGVVLQFSARIR